MCLCTDDYYFFFIFLSRLLKRKFVQNKIFAQRMKLMCFVEHKVHCTKWKPRRRKKKCIAKSRVRKFQISHCPVNLLFLSWVLFKRCSDSISNEKSSVWLQFSKSMPFNLLIVSTTFLFLTFFLSWNLVLSWLRIIERIKEINRRKIIMSNSWTINCTISGSCSRYLNGGIDQ